LFVNGRYLRLELRYIYEKVRRRVSSQYAISSSAWDPKLVDVPSGERFLVLSPHTDDEAIGCGGTIMKLLGRGRSVRVVHLSNQRTGMHSSSERLAEARKAMEILGVTNHVVVQDEFPSFDDLRGIIAGEMCSGNYDAVFLPSPIENHDQHLATCRAWAESMASLSRGAAVAILFEVWTPLIPNMLVDVTDVMPRKIEAIRAYGSQVELVDYARAVEGLSSYRAAMAGRNGYLEAFLSIQASDLNDLLRT
jgi:LmbE family N-acetylglucosaminyl deacetylase